MNQTIDQRWGYLCLIASMTAIGVATISPFNFILPKNLPGVAITDGFIWGSDIKDYWQNILLFVPYGFSLGMVWVAGKYRYQVFWRSLVMSLVLSTTIELTQLLLPSRVSNFTDIIYNTIGGGVGSWLYLQATPITRFLTLAITGKHQQLSYQSILVATVGYYSLIGFAVVVLLTSNNFNNWSTSYYLALGNEVTGNLPWSGSLQSLYLSDRALSPSQIAEAFEQTENFFASETHLVTAIVAEGQDKTIRDRQQTLPPLVWQQNSVTQSAIEANPQNKSQTVTLPKPNPHPASYYQGAIKLNREHWLKTQLPATKVINRLKTSDRFTISLTVASHNLRQGGPARILAISQDIFAQNLAIAQRQDRLYFRLRTPITGRNPVDPAFSIPQVFDDFDFHQIIITFEKRTLTVYLDRPQNSYSYTFRPDVSFTMFIPKANREWNVNLERFSMLKYQLLFYPIVVLPLVWAIITTWFKITKDRSFGIK